MNHITYDIKLLMEASNGWPLSDLRNFSRSSAWPEETEGIVGCMRLRGNCLCDALRDCCGLRVCG